MAVTFDLPPELEESLRREIGDLDAIAKEAALVELYRRDRVGARELGEALGLNRLEVDEVLKRHHVTEDLPTYREICDEVESLDRLLKRP